VDLAVDPAVDRADRAVDHAAEDVDPALDPMSAGHATHVDPVAAATVGIPAVRPDSRGSPGRIEYYPPCSILITPEITSTIHLIFVNHMEVIWD